LICAALKIILESISELRGMSMKVARAEKVRSGRRRVRAKEPE